MQGKITLVEKGGRNDFGKNEIHLGEPAWNEKRCKVCGDIVPAEKVSNTTISSRRNDEVWVFACRECRIKMEKFAQDEPCPNCGDPIDQWAPDKHICFTGHNDFTRTPKLAICEPCFVGYEEIV